MSGQSAAAQTLETTDLVSLGKAIGNAGLIEGFFGALCNRLAKTVYFIRVYDPVSKRAILRDEHEFGAFVQKVYYAAPDFVDNEEYTVPDNSSPTKYQTKSPYDVTTTVAISAKIFDAFIIRKAVVEKKKNNDMRCRVSRRESERCNRPGFSARATYEKGSANG